MIRFKSILHKGALFIALFELFSLAEAKADDGIDGGTFTTAFNWEIALPPTGGEFDTELNGLPMWGAGNVTQLLGTVANVAFTFTGRFDWQNPEAGNFVGSATETINFTIRLGNYIPGQQDLTKSFPVSAFCQYASSCDSVHLTDVTSDFLFPPVNGTAIQGVSAPISLTSSFSGTQGGAFVGGPIDFTGQAVTDIQYTPFTDSKYVQESLNANPGTGGLARGYPALGFLTTLRNYNAATSSDNLSLRNAEYAVYGYNAGAQLATGGGIASLLSAQGSAAIPGGYAGPVAWVAYEGLKVAAELGCTVCAQGIARLGTGLPPSPPGGLLENTIGFLYGLANPNDISGLPTALDGDPDPFSILNHGTLIPPLLTLDLGPSSGSSFGLFGFNATAGSPILLDPTLANTFVFAAIGADFSGIELPLVPGTQEISSATLTVDGKSVTIDGDTWYSFEDLFGFDPSAIAISDLIGALLPKDLQFGFTFDASGVVAVADVEFNGVAGAVPESPTWLLAVAGFAVLAFAGGRARRRAAILQH